MICCTVIALILCSNGIQAVPKPLDQKISLDVPGYTVKQSLRDLSQKTGLVFVANDDINNDQLLIHVTDVTVSDLMNHIAKIEYGKWYINDGEYHLQRDNEAFQAWKEGCLKQEILQIKNGISNLTAKNSAPFDAKAILGTIRNDIKNPENLHLMQGQGNVHDLAVVNSFFKARSSLPLGRALVKFAQGLPISELAKIGFVDRVVYSNHPTSLQYPLPNSKQVIEELASDQKEWTNALHGSDLASNAIQLNSFSSSLLEEPVHQDSTFDLSVKNNYGLGLSLDLRVFNDKGIQIGNSILQVGIPDFTAKQDTLKGGQSVPTPAQALLYKKILLSGMYQDIQDPSPLITPEIRNILIHPEIHAPVSLIAYPILKAVCDANHLNLISNCKFLATLFGSQQLSKEISLETIQELAPSDLVKLDKSGGWLTFQPAAPYISDLTDLNLNAFGALLRTGIQDERVVPIAFTKFAAENTPIAAENPILRAYIQAFCGQNSFQYLNIQPDTWGYLQLIGSLNSVQWNEASSKLGILVSELSPDQLAILRRSLFFQFSNFVQVDDIPGGALQNGDYSRMPEINEPTYAFCNGFPPGVRLYLNTDPQITYKLGKPSPSSGIYTVDMLANSIFELGSKMDGEQITKQTIESLMISLYFPKGFKDYHKVQQWYGPTTSLTVSDWHQLPPKDLLEIESYLNRKGK